MLFRSFSRPGKFVWFYKKTYEQRIQSDGNKLYIYDKDLNQVTIRQLGSALGDSPAAILFGNDNLSKNFTLRDIASKDGYEWLEAIPKKTDTPFEKINIGMKGQLPAVMELYDAMGQVSIIQFHQVEKNPAISSATFTFTAPQGADVFSH